MEKAIKLPSGNYRIRVSYKDDNGNTKRKSITAYSKKECETMAIQFREQKNRPESEKTLRAALTEYIKLKENVLSPTTIQGYEMILKHRFKDIMDLKLSDLNDKNIQQSINSMQLAPKTIINSYGLLRSVLRHYNIDSNITLPRKVKHLRELPSVSDIVTIVKDTNIELPVLLSLWLSLRMSEIRGLRKSDLKGNRLYIQNSIVTVNNCTVEKEATKTYDSTRVHIVPDYLLKLIEQQADNGSDYIVPLTNNQLYKRFARLLQRNNIPHMSFHDLRHMNASVMLSLGISDKLAMERGGWSTPSVLKSVYQHTFSSDRTQADAVINDYFNALVNK